MIHNSKPEDAHPYLRHDSGEPEWYRLPSGVEVSPLPLLDGAHPGLFARLNYDEAMQAAAHWGGRLVSEETVRELMAHGLQLTPYLGTPIAETGLEHSQAHDLNVWQQLERREWDRVRPVSGAGKHWIAGAPPGRSRLMGWDKDGDGPGQALWQPPSVAHNRQHFDDGTTTMIERGTRSSETAEPPEDDIEAKDTIPELAIISTQEWGAAPAPERGTREAMGIVIHHMASPAKGPNRRPSVDPEAEYTVARMLARNCQRDHIQRGWGDTGQHFTVTRGGVVLEGRTGTLRAARQGLVVHGAHAGKAVNGTHWGIEVEGNYHTNPLDMPTEQWEALVALCRWLHAVGNLDPDTSLSGHRKWRPTVCPAKLAGRLPELRAACR